MHFPVTTALGSILIGCVIAAMIYGCTCYQMYIYLQTSKDSRWFRRLITFVWILDTIHMTFVIHVVYYYMIKNYGNTVKLEASVWSVIAQVYLATTTDSIVRGVYARRIWLLSGKDVKGRLLVISIVVTAAFTFITAVIFATKMLMTMHTPAEKKNVFFIHLAFSGIILCDFLIAGSLCVALSKHRGIFRRTNSMINIVILYTVNTSLLTTICALACLIAAVGWPETRIYLALVFTISKLYVTSLLSALNTRQAVWEKCFGGQALQKSSVHSPGPNFNSQSIVVKMERVIEVDDLSSNTAGEMDIEMQKKYSSNPGEMDMDMQKQKSKQ